MDIKILQSFTYLADYISKYVSDNSGNLSNTHVISVSSLDRMYIDALYKYFKSNNSSCISQFRVSTGINLYHRSNRSLEKQISFLTSESSSLLRIWIQTMNNNSTCNEPTRRSTRAKRAPIRPDMTQAHVRKKIRTHHTLSADPADEENTPTANTADQERNPSSSSQQPLTSLPNNGLFTTMDNFVKSLYVHTYKTCELCHQRSRWSSHSFKYFTECDKCRKDVAKQPYISRFSFENDMDPLFHPDKLAREELKILQNEHQLNEIEQMLISLHLPIMKVYRLKGRDNGNLCFSGNVINVTQNLDSLVSKLPRNISDLPIVIVRKHHVKDDTSEKYIDFKVNMNSVLLWLRFLRKYNPVYRDIEIDESYNIPSNLQDVFNHLQVDDSREHQLNEHGEDDRSNKTSSISTLEDNEGGVNDGPLDVNEDDNILETCVSGISDNDDTMESQKIHNLITGTSILKWPTQGDLPIDEYKTDYLLTKSFPTLFPFGNGDFTNKTKRVSSVSLHEAMQHYQTYARRSKEDTHWEYPFSMKHRFMFYLHDMDERHRSQANASVYIKKCPQDSNMSVAQLKSIARSSDPEDISMFKRIQRFGGTILGSDAYLYQRKKELLQLISQKGHPTVWFTLSLANFYWRDLWQLLDIDDIPKEENEDEDTYFSRMKKIVQERYSIQPHVVDEFFCHRVKEFVHAFFGKNGHECEYYWYRFEFQKKR